MASGRGEQLVALFHDQIVADNVRQYTNLFETALASDVRDDYWIRLLDFHRRLNGTDRRMLVEIMAQVSVDTLSNLLLIADAGVEDRDGNERTLSLSLDGEDAGGDLQDAFLAHDEVMRGRQ